MVSKTGQSTVPNIFLNSEHIGGFDNLSKLNSEGRLKSLLSDSKAAASSGIRPKASETIEEFVNKLIKDNKVMIFSKETCPFCVKIKELFSSINQKFVAIELDNMGESL